MKPIFQESLQFGDNCPRNRQKIAQIEVFGHFLDFASLEHVYMRPEVNSNRFDISLRGKIPLRCEVTSVSAFT